MEQNIFRDARLLVVTHDSSILGSLSAVGRSNCWQVEVARDVWEVIDKVRLGLAVDLLLLDMLEEQRDGLQILRSMLRLRPALPIVLIGFADDVEREREAVRMDFCEYIARPFKERELERAIRRNLSLAAMRNGIAISGDDVEPLGNGGFFVGASMTMRKLRAQVEQLAEIDLPVFILGEPGSGKETIARLLHRLSIRSGFAFGRVNCAALPEELLEREVFGGETGDGCDSLGISRGKLEQCDKGTLFLEEIAEMPLRLQSRLLTVLQSGQFLKKASLTCVNVDVRIVVASSKSLDQVVSERKLLAELARLVGAYELHVPALRHRKEELPVLSRHLMHKLSRRYGLSPRDLTPAICDAWQEHEWPGNMRELEQAVKRYLVVGDKGVTLHKAACDGREETGERGSERKIHRARRTISHHPEGGICGYKSLRALLQSIKSEAEKNAIAFALEKTGWNRKAAARLLKTSYRTVLYKIEQYQLSTSNSILLSETRGAEHLQKEFSGISRTDMKASELSGIG